MFKDLARRLLSFLRCPCAWYCFRAGRMDCARCKDWETEMDARLERLEGEMLDHWLDGSR